MGHYGGHSDPRRWRKPPAWREPPEDRTVVKDRSGHSDFPAGLAGDRQKAARPPSGKAPATRMPAPNGASGVAGVRRVQLHPSRFSVSAKQTLKISIGPC
ncbi:hypothetical protein NDU88_005245 [Pleurodeles waltl]|uniref:Uncharacterized protein n=1 Tax=Pleurodeles waltl TaxID=8319 RepID=A0AAV7LRM1_PLEWA|nr:hypothetical protein NDU88_005245 [Pleurodeles waltl]